MTVQAATRPNERLEFIDGLRALAALFVVAHHTALYLRPIGAIPRLLGAFFAPGKYAVDVFIVLSGYCLALPLRRTGALTTSVRIFFQRRVRRIFPPYFAALIVSLILGATLLRHRLGTPWDESVPATPVGIVSHFLLLQDWMSKWVNRQVNYVFWSIAIEWHIYFLFPLMIFSGIWKNFRVGFAWVAGLVVLALVGQPTWLNRANFALYALFCLGVVTARISFHPGKVAQYVRGHSWLGVTVVGVLACGALWIWLPWPELIRMMPLADLICGLAVSALLIELSSRSHSPLRTFLSWEPLVGIGIFSYSLYLIHAPLLELLWLLTQRLGITSYPGNFVAVFGVGQVLLVWAGWVFYRCFERPFLRPSQRAAIARETSHFEQKTLEPTASVSHRPE